MKILLYIRSPEKGKHFKRQNWKIQIADFFQIFLIIACKIFCTFLGNLSIGRTERIQIIDFLNKFKKYIANFFIFPQPTIWIAVSKILEIAGSFILFIQILVHSFVLSHLSKKLFFHVSFVQIGFNSPSLVIVMRTQLSCLLVQMTIGFSITSWMFIFIWTLLAQVLTVSWTSCRSVLKAFSWFAKPLNKGFIFLNALFRTLTVTLSVFWNRKIENYPACFYIMNIGFLQYSSDISTR